MAAVYVSNLVINAGSDFSQTFDLIESDDSGALNLDGFTVTSQFRKHAGSSSKHDFTNWTKSEAFRLAHKNSGHHKGLYLGHPNFEGFEVIF